MSLDSLPQYTNKETFEELLGDLYGHWWALHVDYPFLEDEYLDAFAAKKEIETILRLDDMTNKEYRQRIRAVIVLYFNTLGDAVTLKLLQDHPILAIIQGTYLIDQAAVGSGLNQPYAFPCLLNTMSNLAIMYRPSDVDVAMQEMLTYLGVHEDAQKEIVKTFTVVAPIIH